MKVLIVGGGGREHALAWKAVQSAGVSEVIVAPGNAGTACEPRVRNVAIEASNVDALVELAVAERVGFTIVGPELPLVAGIVDRFAARGLKCFGPSSQAAKLEGSKAYAKRFLARHRIPTAAYGSFDRLAAAREFVRAGSLPIVIKADGLAAGKGVIIAQTLDEADRALEQILAEGAFGGAGKSVVVEEFLTGEEASFIAVVAGREIVPMASSQDHKTRDDGDKGPNTGGMGANSPAPIVDAAMHERVMQEIMLPTINGLADEGIAYRGFLYAGLMIGLDGQPRVLEFNCRLGDPETQPILFRLESDLVALLLDAMEGRLERSTPRWSSDSTVGVVMASAGYPGDYASGHRITGLDRIVDPRVKVFHAGTQQIGGQTCTAGGRVLCVVGRDASVGAARGRAYRAVEQISWEGAFWRTDIGYRALARERR